MLPGWHPVRDRDVDLHLDGRSGFQANLPSRKWSAQIAERSHDDITRHPRQFGEEHLDRRGAADRGQDAIR